MKRKPTNWDRYLAKQMTSPVTRDLVEQELKALRVGVQIAELRERCRLTQTELAAKVGMSGPNISRIETQPAQNLTLGTLVKVSKALNCEVIVGFKPNSRPRKRSGVPKGRP